MDQPHVVRISEVIKENDFIHTITFPCEQKTIPGQFFMIWIPGIDEIPMSVSQIQSDQKSITFREVGEATKALFQLKRNDKIGIRGPYGNGFSLKGKHPLFVGGGTGIAMIAPTVEYYLQHQTQPVEVIFGAKTKHELFFQKRMEKTDACLHITTDDGSEGEKGFASDHARNLMEEKPIDMVYTCGPEPMMKSLTSICQNQDIPLQASVERYMKCAVGLCGQCCIGDGLRVCIEGPIFTSDQLRQIKDFGVYKRDASGKKTYFSKDII